ncbi:hypothetical protein IE53DRAFT_145799 [Violaceomyces palustris]|uniref:Uncharacterized protein n=1 Tax=Violaceomyces palustris TaxID=1673888 RepID=A0ACD0P6F6_9BASI|nr:hypothetical protein IE53DRAFT_145799 [Violaceomyces palustris]
MCCTYSRMTFNRKSGAIVRMAGCLFQSQTVGLPLSADPVPFIQIAEAATIPAARASAMIRLECTVCLQTRSIRSAQVSANVVRPSQHGCGYDGRRRKRWRNVGQFDQVAEGNGKREEMETQTERMWGERKGVLGKCRNFSLLPIRGTPCFIDRPSAS